MAPSTETCFMYKQYNVEPKKCVVTDGIYCTFLSTITTKYLRQNLVPNHVSAIIKLLGTVCLLSS